MNKTAASAAQLAKCIFLHAYSHRTASSQLRENKQKFIAYLTSWHKSIFGFQVRTTEAENPKKVKNSKPQLRIYWFL